MSKNQTGLDIFLSFIVKNIEKKLFFLEKCVIIPFHR